MPSAFSPAMPLAGAVRPTIDSRSPSASRSFPRGSKVIAVSSGVERVSETATGASLRGATRIVTVAGLESSRPSLTTYVKVSVPKKSAFGV